MKLLKTKKLIELPADAIRELKKRSKIENRSVKNLIETIIIENLKLKK